jgi:hypothetical protein
MQPSKLLAVVVLAVIAGALVSLPIQSAFAAAISLTISPNPAPQDGGGTHVTFSGTEAPAKTGATIYIGIFGYPGCSGGTPFITQSTTEQSSGDYSLILTTSAIGGVGYYSAIAFDPSTNALSACQSFTITYGSTLQWAQNLINLVNGMNLPNGLTQSLDAKLQAALTSINSERNIPATNQLNAFINEVNAQAGKKITSAQAAQLIAAANDIIKALH